MWHLPKFMIGAAVLCMALPFNDTDRKELSILSARQCLDEAIVVTAAGVKIRLIPVEAGSFMMGSKKGEMEEKIVHKVELDGFAMMEHEVTWELWEAIMGTKYGKKDTEIKLKGFYKVTLKRYPDYPITMISWDEIQVFIKKLNELTGKKFRLPTEAEWEYAAKGGNKSKGYEYSGGNGLDSIAWYAGNSKGSAQAVKQKKPNELGIYDLTGSVIEWCNDWSDVDMKEYYYNMSPLKNPQGPETGLHKVVRGGGWDDDASVCVPYFRMEYKPDAQKYDVGFRLVISQSDL